MLRDNINTDTPDESLMEAFLAGHGTAFDILYRRRRDGIFHFFNRQCRSEAIAQELCQEVWMKVLRVSEAGTYKPDAKFTTFLYTIARNQLIDWYRRQKRQGSVNVSMPADTEDEDTDNPAEQVPDDGPSPEQILHDNEVRTLLREAIDQLSEVQRATVLMHMEQEMSYEDIAEAMGTERETVKSRLRYARNHLRAYLAAHVERPTKAAR